YRFLHRYSDSIWTFLWGHGYPQKIPHPQHYQHLSPSPHKLYLWAHFELIVLRWSYRTGHPQYSQTIDMSDPVGPQKLGQTHKCLEGILENHIRFVHRP